MYKADVIITNPRKYKYKYKYNKSPWVLSSWMTAGVPNITTAVKGDNGYFWTVLVSSIFLKKVYTNIKKKQKQESKQEQ